MADTVTTQQDNLAALLKEHRVFPPSDDFRRQANVSDPAIYERARQDLEAFWAEEAEHLDWFKRWDKVLEWKIPWAKWFVGGKLNVTYNCVDRHAKSARRNKAAIIWEGEPGDSRVLTFGMLEREVNRCANALKSLGVKKGDRVAVYMGMVPELSIALLACAKIGAPHSVVFGGFSADALRERINDAQAKVVVHTTAGYLTGVSSTHRIIFDVKENDVYWCTADIGWVTGHSYIVYGPLANGSTSLMYEGTPDYPDRGRFWEIVAKYGVNIFYTAPTAIRTFLRWGEQWPSKYDLSSLRVIGTVGEPINPEAWIWYHQNIGPERCPIVDTWWQTETGMVLITPLPGITATKPGSATRPFPGIEAEVLDEKGGKVGPGAGGYLVLTKPWPAMFRTIYGDPDRYVKQYWSRYPGKYFTGDGAKVDADGYFWLLGRVDDVMNVAGHRISTYEVESALVDHASVAEAAVIGRSHDVKGQGIASFVTLKEGVQASDQLKEELKAHVAKKIGSIARPDDIFFTSELPKTRSAKIMRRLLRDIAEGRILGDTTTLADPAAVSKLKQQYEEEGKSD